jgi:hypothetical protein
MVVVMNFTISLVINVVFSIQLYIEGLDFFYATEACARKMVDFLVSVSPWRSQQSKKMLSHDIHSNVYNYKFTYRWGMQFIKFITTDTRENAKQKQIMTGLYTLFLV